MSPGRALATALLVFNLFAAVAVLGLSAWHEDRKIDEWQNPSVLNRKYANDLKGFEGNAATGYLMLFSLVAGLVAVASYFVGLHHLRVWTSPSAAAAQASAWIACLLLMSPFALVCKEMALKTARGDNLIMLESFVIVLTFAHFIYTVLLYSPVHTLGDMSRKDPNEAVIHTNEAITHI